MSLQRAAENTKIKNYLGCLHFSYATHHLTFNKSGLFPRNYKSRSSKISFFLFFFFNHQVLTMGQTLGRAPRKSQTTIWLHHRAMTIHRQRVSNQRSEIKRWAGSIKAPLQPWTHSCTFPPSSYINVPSDTDKGKKINHFMHFSMLPCYACYQSKWRNILHSLCFVSTIEYI